MTRITIHSCLLAFLLSNTPASAEDWTDWRGPRRDGHSSETGLPSSWSRDGENLAWRVPYGGTLDSDRSRRSRLSPKCLGRRCRPARTHHVFPCGYRRAPLGASHQSLHERGASSSRRVGLARRRSEHRERVRVYRGRRPVEFLFRRGATLGSITQRRFWSDHDPRRPHRITRHRRRPSHRQRVELRLGRASAR